MNLCRKVWKHLNTYNTFYYIFQILTLNSGIERVKQQQQQLDQELDFVLSQQKELEDLIVPLEKELAEVPVHDQDRHEMYAFIVKQTLSLSTVWLSFVFSYQMAENLDTQLKQMSDDLKEVIDHLNESTKSQELQDPVRYYTRRFFYVFAIMELLFDVK